MLSAVCHPKLVAPCTTYSTKSLPGDVALTLPLSCTENTVPNIQNPFFCMLLNGILVSWFPVELWLFLLTVFYISDFSSTTLKEISERAGLRIPIIQLSLAQA